MNPGSKLALLFSCLVLASCASSPNGKLAIVYDVKQNAVAVVPESEFPQLNDSGKNPQELPLFVPAPEANKINWRNAGVFALKLGANLLGGLPDKK